MFLYTWDNRKEDMTEEEFLALVNLVEFVQQSKKIGDKLDKDLSTVRELIKRQGDLYVKV